MRRDNGFTLLEVLIAFVIAAIAVAALLQGAGGGLAATQLAAQTQDALSRARSRLAATPLTPGEQSGTEPGGYTWRTLVQPTTTTPQAALYTLIVTVAWTTDAHRRQVTLSTQRLAEAPSAPP